MIFDQVIYPQELEQWIAEGKDFQLVDISHDNILKNHDIDSVWIPSNQLVNNTNKLHDNIPVVLCCHYGESSFMMVNVLFFKHNIKNVYSLKSGIKGWKGN
jgi:rhodanese-related sulfurtransferase